MSSVEPGTTDFVDCLVGNLRAAARVATRRYDAALRDHGLRITQIAIMAQVRMLQPVTVTRLAAELSCERSVVARDVAVLEREGLVRIDVDAADRRARAITLTGVGAQRLRNAAPAWRRAQHDLRDALGPELADLLLGVTRRLVTVLDGA